MPSRKMVAESMKDKRKRGYSRGNADPAKHEQMLNEAHDSHWEYSKSRQFLRWCIAQREKDLCAFTKPSCTSVERGARIREMLDGVSASLSRDGKPHLV